MCTSRRIPVCLALAIVCFVFAGRVSASDLVIDGNTVWTGGVYDYNNVVVTSSAVLSFTGNVTLNAQSLTIDAGASVSAKGAGYPGEQGPGVGGFYSGHTTGGGYGGKGGARNGTGGVTYGSALAPVDMGSGGGANSFPGNFSGAGGGAIRIIVNELILNGLITANGTDGNSASGYDGGGGSGGSVYITTNQLSGAGSITANGGYGRYGGGGGGRIAVYYQVSSFTGTSQAKGGTGITTADYGQNGTVVFIDSANDTLFAGQSFRFEQTDAPISFQEIVLNASNTTVGGSVTLAANELTLDANSIFTITGDTTLLDVETLNIDGNSAVVLAGNSKLDIGSGLNISNSYIATPGPLNLVLPSDDITLNNGAAIKWGSGTYTYNNISLTGNSTLVFNGSVTLQADSVTIDPCCSISALGTGFPGEQGPGVGGLYNGNGTGGGHGGKGGSRNNSGGLPYGSAMFPAELGSGGGNSSASINLSGAGGGTVRLDVDSLTVNGAINAGGSNATSAIVSGITLYGGGGSGGSAYISARQLSGNGSISVNGGYGAVGGGAGGRVAVYYSSSSFTGTVESKGGTGLSSTDYGQDGSVIVSGPSQDSPASVMQASATYTSQNTLSETLRVLKANLTGVAVSGDFNSTINFSDLNVVTVETGSFAGQGFAKANWQVNLDGIDYAGSLRAVANRVQSSGQAAIHFKGVISGDISGIAEGALIEPNADPNAVLAFNSTWMLNRLKDQAVASSIDLSGALTGPQITTYPGTSLHVVQGSFDANCYGSYNGPLGVILTQVSIASTGNPYYGNGFSNLSYISNAGQGLAAAFSDLESPGVSILKGAIANPLLGIINATLNENSTPAVLSVAIERVDLGLEPQSLLDVKIIGPSRVSPGQTVSYVLEYSNQGVKTAENVLVTAKLPKNVQIDSYSADGYFRATGSYDGSPEVSWEINSISPQTKGRLTATAVVNWGLPNLSSLDTYALVQSFEQSYQPDVNLDTTIVDTNNVQVDARYVFSLDGSPVFDINSLALALDSQGQVIEPNLTYTGDDSFFDSLLQFTANPWFRMSMETKGGQVNNLEILVQCYIMSQRSDLIVWVGAAISERQFLQWLRNNDYISQSAFERFSTDVSARVVVKWNADAIIGKFQDENGYYEFISQGVRDKLINIPADELGAYIIDHESQKQEPRVRIDTPENAIADALASHMREEQNYTQPPPQTPPDDASRDQSWWSNFFRQNKQSKLSLPWHPGDVWMNAKRAIDFIRQLIAAAFDPNKKYGPQGRVLPGQKLDYRVEFENVGAGIAYGVYFTDTLDEDVNDATLQIGPVLDVNTGQVLAGPGSYNPATRTITWFVGQVDPEQGGYADFSVNVNPDAAHETEIVNYATIYFPSVPQQLTTNAIVSTVILNQAPIANAGPDQTAFIGQTIVLNGSASTDPDGDLLTFKWAFGQRPDGSQAVLADSNSLNPNFVPDLRGTYTVTLIVNDGNVDSTFDAVKISTINVAPVANAGADQTVRPGDTVSLNGSASNDSDGDLLTYNWAFESVPQGSSVVLDDPNSVNPTFTADIAGNYVVRLTVNDGFTDSAPDTVVIATTNLAPLASAGEDQAVHLGDLVTLDGSASSDPDGDTLTYQWVFTVIPEGSAADLNDANSVHPTFTADLPGSYVLILTVNDGLQDSAPDTVTVSTINVAPIAAAGDDQSVYPGSVVDLNGLSSWDPDGDSLTYNWSFTALPAGSEAVLNNADSATPSFTADVSGTYVVGLTVSDGWLNSAPDTVVISTINASPTADAGNDQSVVAGSQVTLDGSQSSDPDGDTLIYKWAFTSKPGGSTAALSNPVSVNPSFTADKPGIYVLTLVVNDGIVDSAPESVTVSAVSQQTWAIEMTQQIIRTINGMNKHDFRNGNNKKALTNKLNAVIDAIERERFRDAIRKLENDVLRKTDGCAEVGHPDFSDWIIKCDSQALIYQPILDVIDVLETIPRACCAGCRYGNHRPGCRNH